MKRKIFRIMAVMAMLIPMFAGLLGMGESAEADSGQAQFTIHKMNFDGKIPNGGPWENTGDKNDLWGGLNQNGTLDGKGVEFSAYDVTEKYYNYLALETADTYKEKRDNVIKKLQTEYENMTGNSSESGYIMTQANSSNGAFVFDDPAFVQKKTVNGEEKYPVYIFVETKTPDNTIGKQFPIVAILPILDKTGKPMSFIDIYGKNEIGDEDPSKGLTDSSQVDIINGQYGNVTVGDILDYTITIPIGSQTTQVKISDNPTGGLKYVDNSAKIMPPGTNPSGSNLGGKLVPNGSGGFTIDLSGTDLAGLAGQDLVINYQMEVTEEAVPDVEMTNDAQVGYNGNDPNVDLVEKPDKPNPPLYTGGKKFIKVDSTDNATILKGAEFYVSRGTGADEEVLLVNSDGAYKWVEKSTLDSDVFTDKASIEGYSDTDGYKIKTLTSNDSGEFSIEGIQYGDNYYLNEYVAPDGYKKLTSPILFEVIKDGYNAVDGILNVENVPEGYLPETGGKGIFIFLLIGAALMGGAAIWYKKSRKGTAEV